MQRTHLLVIDPQNDLCDPRGSLFVQNADKDMSILSSFVEKNINKIFDIHVTLDSHHLFQIFHPMFWRTSDGKMPAPFTMITINDIENGKMTTAHPKLRDQALAYIKALSANKRYSLVIWPEHCLIGSWGTQVTDPLFKALCKWERQAMGMVDYVTKGSNPLTEHYSAVKAEVSDPHDPSTQINQTLIDLLKDDAEVILVAGEALDYCVYNTLKDTITAFGPDNAKKIKILKDCTSAIDSKAISKIEAEFKSHGIEFVDTTYFDK